VDSFLLLIFGLYHHLQTFNHGLLDHLVLRDLRMAYNGVVFHVLLQFHFSWWRFIAGSIRRVLQPFFFRSHMAGIHGRSSIFDLGRQALGVDSTRGY
jgi:hypothetical protein